MTHKLTCLLATLPLALVTTAAIAGSKNDTVPLEQCLHAAQSVRQGDIVKVEYLSVSPVGAPTYEIEIRDDSDKEWELMCNARSGDIYELETEAESADDEMFARHAKISEEDAIKTAQDRFGGEVVEVEYEIESDGSPSYEIDLAQDGQDTEFKVEVDAVSGEIIELSVEQWQIGQEPEEKVDASN
ncbi:PepSY domain-containing protein [Salinisphaera dokdonensis]|uniref:PepSY domain-containing protein n=1 Tax=Salinisphaera dokdonensis TaxID=454598 RepID=UPI003341C97A